MREGGTCRYVGTCLFCVACWNVSFPRGMLGVLFPRGMGGRDLSKGRASVADGGGLSVCKQVFSSDSAPRLGSCVLLPSMVHV